MSGPQSRSLGGFEDAKRAKMLRQVSEDAPSRLGLFERVYSSLASPREAIKAQCLACRWMDEAAIRECTATQCTLWEFRPFVRPKGRAGR